MIASSKVTQSPSSSSQGKINIHGYVHGISELKILQTGNQASQYFDFKAEERDEVKRAICFSPDKWDAFKEKQHSKTPVTPTNVVPRRRNTSLNKPSTR